jgi:hypothetical protein
LFFADEIRDPHHEIDNLPGRVKVSQKELRMAGQLIDAMSEPWKPSDYRDTYTDRVNELIDAKKHDKQFEPAAEAPGATSGGDLADVLRASLDTANLKACRPCPSVGVAAWHPGAHGHMADGSRPGASGSPNRLLRARPEPDWCNCSPPRPHRTSSHIRRHNRLIADHRGLLTGTSWSPPSSSASKVSLDTDPADSARGPSR